LLWTAGVLDESTGKGGGLTEKEEEEAKEEVVEQ
jgi:hypothetical protein